MTKSSKILNPNAPGEPCNTPGSTCVQDVRQRICHRMSGSPITRYYMLASPSAEAAAFPPNSWLNRTSRGFASCPEGEPKAIAFLPSASMIGTMGFNVRISRAIFWRWLDSMDSQSTTAATGSRAKTSTATSALAVAMTACPKVRRRTTPENKVSASQSTYMTSSRDTRASGGKGILEIVSYRCRVSEAKLSRTGEAAEMA